MPTLIFHGAPPLASATPRPTAPPLPPPRAPRTRPEGLDDHVAFDLVNAPEPSRPSAEPLDDSDICLLDPDDSHADMGPEAPALAARMARSERPPPMGIARLPWERIAVIGACVLGLAWVIGVSHAARSRWAQVTSRAAATAVANAHPAETASAKAGASDEAIAPAAGRCAVAGSARVLARRALVKGGVEATSSDDRVAFAVVSGTKEAIAFELDPSSLAVTSTARLLAAEPVRRAVPALFADMPLAAEIDPAAMRVVPDPDGDALIGARAGYVVWGPRDADVTTKLWKLDGPKDIEAPRVVSLGASGERAVVFRRAGAIWVGAFRASDTSPSIGAMVRVSDGFQVGAPAVDALGDEIVIAWAQRDARTAPWGVRWTRWRSGADADKPRALALPPGGPGQRAFAPSVASLDGGRFLLAWTEGAGARHQVRAQVIDELDRPQGDALPISPPDVIAGQEQVAVASSGRGAVAYLSSKGRAFELSATPITCAHGATKGAAR